MSFQNYMNAALKTWGGEYLSIASDRNSMSGNFTPPDKVAIGKILYQINWSTGELTPYMMSANGRAVNGITLVCFDESYFPEQVYMVIGNQDPSTLRIKGYRYQKHTLVEDCNHVPKGTLVLSKIK